MSNDIEEFLRRAAQRRARQKPLDIEILDAEIVEDAEVVEADVLRGDNLAAHVSLHMDSRQFSERASHLGETVGKSDDEMEAHLHDVFEHQLGDLGGMTGAAEDSILDDDGPKSKQPAKAKQRQPGNVAALLRTPQNLRDAIILSEIINRPEHRW